MLDAALMSYLKKPALMHEGKPRIFRYLAKWCVLVPDETELGLAARHHSSAGRTKKIRPALPSGPDVQICFAG
jgi:hypothetical protein